MAETKEKSEPTFPRERLIRELDVPDHVVAGALAELGGDGELTVERAKDAVEKFLKREVK